MSNNNPNICNSDNKEIMLKEIDLIQSCISRMAQNSFAIKGWDLTLNGVIMGLFADKGNPIVTQIICIVSVICFWGLDAFFLRTEKLFRWKYDWVISERPKKTDYAYDLNPYNKEMWLKTKNKKGNMVDRKKPWVLRIMVTKTLWPMYVTILIVNIAFIIYHYCCSGSVTP